jgi:tight adherence protein C
MTNEFVLIALASGFLATLLAGFAAVDHSLERRRVAQQLRTMRSFEIDPTDVRARELAAPVRTRLLFPGARRVVAAAKRITPSGVTERLAQDLRYAGSPAGFDAERILVMKLSLAVGLGLLGFATGVAIAQPLIGVLAPVFGAFVGWFAPEWVVRSRGAARQEEIGGALPDALDLLSITVEAGLGFDSALSRVAGEMGGPLGQEPHRTVQEMRLGKSRQEALRGLSERTNVPPLREFVLAMIQADVFGISISQVLKVQAEDMRVKRRQAIEEKAMRVPVKMIFPLIMFILPATFIVLAGPAVLRIIDAFGGDGAF